MPLLGYKHTEETKRKMSIAQKGNRNGLGHKQTKEHIRKGVESRKGYRHSEETRKKIGKANKGNKFCLGYKHTLETKKKVSEALKGRLAWNKGRKMSYEYGEKCRKRQLGIKPSKETKRRMSKSQKGKIISRETKRRISQGNTGKIRTEEMLIKLSESHKGINLGCEHPNWLGGISFEPYGLAWTEQLKESIRERDNNVCQLCNKHQSQLKRRLSVHHIDYIKTNIFTFNLISLCLECHGLTHNNRNRWITFFRNYLNEKYGYSYILQQKTLVKEVYNASSR